MLNTPLSPVPPPPTGVLALVQDSCASHGGVDNQGFSLSAPGPGGRFSIEILESSKCVTGTHASVTAEVCASAAAQTWQWEGAGAGEGAGEGRVTAAPSKLQLVGTKLCLNDGARHGGPAPAPPDYGQVWARKLHSEKGTRLAVMLFNPGPPSPSPPATHYTTARSHLAYYSAVTVACSCSLASCIAKSFSVDCLPGEANSTVVATWQMLGLPAASNAVVRDLWLHTESTATGQVSALVPSHGGVILTLTTA